jgi:YQGE family putative transporter
MFEYFSEFNKCVKSFLATKFFFYAQSAFFSFLINIYFWRITNDISFLVLYNVVFMISHTLAFFPFGKISKEINRFIPLRAGIVMNALFLALILYLKGSIVQYIIPIAVLGGLAHGAYWSSDNLLKFDLTNPKNRLRFTSAYNILNSIAYAVMPLIASIMIVMNGDQITSYVFVFVPALIITVIALVSTFYISNECCLRMGSYQFIKKSKEMLKNRNIRIVCISIFLNNIPSALTLLLSLLLFISSKTELSIGSYQFITVIIGILAYYAIGKYFIRRDYKKLLIYGGLVNFAIIFILFIRQDVFGILIYGILSSIFYAANVAFNPLVQDVLNSYAKSQMHLVNLRVEYVTLQEIFAGIGQIVGFLIVLTLYLSNNFVIIAFVATVLAAMQLLANIYITKVKDRKFVNIDNLNAPNSNASIRKLKIYSR